MLGQYSQEFFIELKVQDIMNLISNRLIIRVKNPLPETSYFDADMQAYNLIHIAVICNYKFYVFFLFSCLLVIKIISQFLLYIYSHQKHIYGFFWLNSISAQQLVKYINNIIIIVPLVFNQRIVYSIGFYTQHNECLIKILDERVVVSILLFFILSFNNTINV